MPPVNDPNPTDAASECLGTPAQTPPSQGLGDWQEWVDGPGPSLDSPSSAPGSAPTLGLGLATPSSPGQRLLPEGEPTGSLGTAAIAPPPLALVETAFLASTTSLLWLINAYFPVGPVWRICMPIPIALVYLRWHRRAAWMTATVASLLLMVFMGPVRSLFFLMPYGLLGVLLGFCWRRGASWGVSIGLGSLINSLGFFFKVGLTSVLLGEDLWIYVTTQVTKLLNWVSINLGLLIQADLALVQLLAIALVFLNSVIYLFVVHLAAWYLLDRLGVRVPPPPRWVQVMLELEVESTGV